MKAIIMAAGRGTRISRHIQDRPKCTVDLGNGVPLIQYTVDTLHAAGITDISLVLGYRAGDIKELLGSRKVKYYENPFFDVTNSLGSLWFARQELHGEDLLVMNGDVFFEKRFLETFIQAKASPLLFSDESRKADADYKLYYRNGVLQKYGKDLPLEEITGEYIGVVKISAVHVDGFRNRLEKMVSQQKHGMWWEDVLYRHCEVDPVHVENVQGQFWAEVDYIEDYERIQRWVAERGI